MKNSLISKSCLTSAIGFSILGAHADSQTQNIDEVILSGSFQTVIEINPPKNAFLKNANQFDTEYLTNTKIISLMLISQTAEMTARAEHIARQIDQRILAEKEYDEEGIIEFSKSPSAKEIIMNVPVLDQGEYGTCVTFATTAAIDAILNAGDFIDQQCALAHNLFLGDNYWRSAYNSLQILKPLKKYGLIEQGQCPVRYPDPQYKIETEEYKKLVSEKHNLDNVKYKYYSFIDLDDVRNAIDKGRLFTFSFFVKSNEKDPTSIHGFNAKIDQENYKGGLWACKQKDSKENYCGFAFAGHQVVVTGYDDTQRLLKIRNSWGKTAGINGNFYMTYEFFDAMSTSGTEIWVENREPVENTENIENVGNVEDNEKIDTSSFKAIVPGIWAQH